MPKYFKQVLTISQQNNKFVNNNDHLFWIQGCLFLYSLPLSTAHYNAGIQAVIQERLEAQEDAALEAEDAALEAVGERNQQKALVRKWQAEHRRGLRAKKAQNFEDLEALRAVYMRSQEEQLVRKLQSEYNRGLRAKLIQNPREDAAVRAVVMRYRQDELVRKLHAEHKQRQRTEEAKLRNDAYTKLWITQHPAAHGVIRLMHKPKYDLIKFERSLGLEKRHMFLSNLYKTPTDFTVWAAKTCTSDLSPYMHQERRQAETFTTGRDNKF
jgi:hypothetical protein